MTRCLIAIAIITTVCLFPGAAANDPDHATLQETFEQSLPALDSGNLDGFLDAVRNPALSFLSCGPTAGKQGREACAPDQRHFFNTASEAKFETQNEPESGTLSGATRATNGQPMEGVAVSARAAGATKTTTVFSDEEGDYFFPPLQRGQYRVWAQAVGFETAWDDVALNGRQGQVTFALNTIADPAPQLSGSEWLAALPEATKHQRRMKEIFRVNCTLCHSPNLPLQSRFDEQGWLAVIDSMLRLNRNTLGVRNAYSTTAFHREELAKYLASVRGPDSPPLAFKFHPRPMGDAARVVITEWDIPTANEPDGLAWFNGSDWSEGVATGGDRGNPIHTVEIDNDGNAWLTAHGRAATWGTLVRLNPQTDQVTGFKLLQPDGSIQGTHSLATDKEGIIWFAATGSLGRLDPRTEEFQIFVPPSNMGAGRGVMTILDVDAHGKVWASTGYGAIRFDPDTTKWRYFQNVTVGDGFNYAPAGDAEGNGWWTQHNMDRVGKGEPGSGKSFEVVMRPPWLAEQEDLTTPADREFYESMGALSWGGINFVPGAQAPRRMGADKNGDSVWVANFFGNNLARIDIDTLETKYYAAPVKGHPYDVAIDKHHNAWTNLMADDRVAKLNPETGRWTLYLLPSHGCQPRDIAVDDVRGEVWVPCRQATRIARLQFRTAQQVEALKERAGTTQ